jgi:hypothetical protein
MEAGWMVMEIAPIPGIRAVPAVKAPPANPRLSAIFDIEHSSEPGDDSYSGSGRKASGGQDDEDVMEMVEVESSSEFPVSAGNVHLVA